MFIFFFFFQAEDGIRDVAVTGVQTCALPILLKVTDRAMSAEYKSSGSATTLAREVSFTTSTVLDTRSGSTLRTACGRTMKASVCETVSPVERAASHWPAPMLSI